MLNQQNDDGGGQVPKQIRGDALVEHGHSCILETCGLVSFQSHNRTPIEARQLTSRNIEQDLKLDLALGEAPVDQPADHGVQQDDKDGPQGGEEKGQALVSRPAFCSVRAGHPYNVEHCQSRQAHGSVQSGARQALKGVDQDDIGCIASGKARDAHHGRNLADTNVDGGSRHKGRKGSE